MLILCSNGLSSNKIITTLQADYSSECAKVENKISGLRSSYVSFSVNPFYAGAFSIDYLKNVSFQMGCQYFI